MIGNSNSSVHNKASWDAAIPVSTHLARGCRPAAVAGVSRGHGAPQILKYSLSGSFQKPLAQPCSAAPPLCAGGVVPAVPWPPACRAWSCPHCPACVPPPFSVNSLPLLPDAATVLLNRLQTHVCAPTHTHTPGCTRVLTHTHAHVYSHTCTYSRYTRVLTHMHIHVHTCAHTRTHTCTHTHARTCAAHVCAHTHTRMNTCVFTQMHYSRVHTCIHMYTHTHTRVLMYMHTCVLTHAWSCCTRAIT